MPEGKEAARIQTMMEGLQLRHCVYLSPACERNKEPILALLQAWLPQRARVLEIGSGSGQHATFFCQKIPGLIWQASERPEALATLQSQLSALAPTTLAPGAELPKAIRLDVSAAEQWPQQRFNAVFSANTCHIMPAMALSQLLAGAQQVLEPAGLLLLYGPFHDGGVHTAESNLSFDAHLRSIDPAMGVRDALELEQQAAALGLGALADVAMPANNRTLIFRLRGGKY